jgi:hypothetical protein
VENVETTLDRLPEDFETAVGNGVESVEPEVDGAGFFTDPVGFFGNLVVEAVNRRIDPDTQAALDELANRE